MDNKYRVALFESVMEDDKLDIYELKAKQSLLKNIKVTEDDCWIDEIGRDLFIYNKMLLRQHTASVDSRD